MSLRRSSDRERNDRQQHRQRSRSPIRHHRHDDEDPRIKKKNRQQDNTSDVDLRRVKREPEDESSEARIVNKARSMPGRNPELHHSPREQRHDTFRQQRDERRKNDKQRIKHRSEQGMNKEQWGHQQHSGSATGDKKPVKEKEKPSLALSGHLTEDTNTFRGVVIKYNEPPEARRPKKHWRFYPFKGEEQLPVLHLHRQSAFLLGRDRRVADIPVDHPSCSKQHAALQFRLVEYTRPDGRTGRRVRPYVIDLGSANGTYVNNQRIESERYVELMEKDVVKFGFSSREYVLLHDSSDTTELDDDEGTA